ncbi:MAG TPA: hypothetical protein V6D17_20145 [Candidatus Obscuribacterales bacterium]
MPSGDPAAPSRFAPAKRVKGCARLELMRIEQFANGRLREDGTSEFAMQETGRQMRREVWQELSAKQERGEELTSEDWESLIAVFQGTQKS